MLVHREYHIFNKEYKMILKIVSGDIVLLVENIEQQDNFQFGQAELKKLSSIRTLRELTEAEISAKESSKEFVEYALTENRLNQGVSKLGEMGHEVSVKSMSHFLKWIGNDILTECKDVLEKSGLERKEVMPAIADKAKSWYFNYLNRFVKSI